LERVIAFAQERTLYWGSSNPDVSLLQQQLKNWGVLPSPVWMGVFGQRHPTSGNKFSKAKWFGA